MGETSSRRRRWIRPLGIGGAVVALLAVIVGFVVVTGPVIDRVFDSTIGQPASGACSDSEVDLIRDAEAGDLARVEDALRDGEDPDDRDRSGNTALACAGPAGHTEVVAALLDAGADPNSVARDTDTVVADAVRFCRLEVLGLLLDAGADPDRAGRADAASPLAQAVASGRTQAATLLLDAGADADAIESRTVPTFDVESTSPCPAPTPEGRAAALAVVLDAGGDPGAVLAVAVTDGSDAVAADALERGADPNRLSLHVRQPSSTVATLACLGAAVEPGPGASGSASTEHPVPTNTAAGSEGCPAVDGVHHLANPRPPTPDGDDRATTPLVMAAWGGRVDMVQALLDAGADPAKTGPNQVTALHAAAGAGADEVVALLLPVAPLPPGGRLPPPSAIAEAAGHHDLTVVLRDAGA